MQLLLVEDNLNLGNALLKLLARHYRVQWVRTLAAATAHLRATEHDVVLLDLGMPDGDGLHWLRSLRASGDRKPVLIISARDTLDERVEGLDTGADDFLVKPFEPDELLARIRALLRRQAGSAEPRLRAGALSFAPELHQFYLDDVEINLPPKERQILTVLIQAGGRPVSRTRLAQELYGLVDQVESNTLEVYIHSLRKTLGRERIETVRGIGYRVVPR